MKMESSMFFRHHGEIWKDFPQLSVGVLHVQGIQGASDVTDRVRSIWDSATRRLDGKPEGELAEIQAWRRAFATMGLKPTQYRCASESLLRRFRKDGSIPPLNPLVDICNAVSLLFAIPIAVFDVTKITGFLEVRYAAGSEIYTPFGGGDESPEKEEVVFADESGRAHSRRWTYRQSGYSAVFDSTREELIVCEALHETARIDVPRLVDTLKSHVASISSEPARSEVFSVPGGEFQL